MVGGELIVVKYGSDSVAGKFGMDQNRIARHVEQLAELHKRYSLVVVSSGAVAVGRSLLPEGEDDLQCLAMAGSAAAFLPWQTEFKKYGISSGQLLITHREIDTKSEGNSMQEAINKYRAKDYVTVANENDALSIQELAKLAYGGDNDGLARHIAVAMGASRLLLLTDRLGLLDDTKKLVPAVVTRGQYAKGLRYATKTKAQDGLGRGGMRSKVKAAWEAAGGGVDAYIGDADNLIADILSGLSTYFPARASHSRIEGNEIVAAIHQNQ